MCNLERFSGFEVTKAARWGPSSSNSCSGGVSDVTEAEEVADPRRFPAFRRALALNTAKAFLKRVRRRLRAWARRSGQRLPEGLNSRRPGRTSASDRRRRSVRGVYRSVLGAAAAHGPVRLVAAVFAGRMALLHEAGRSRV